MANFEKLDVYRCALDFSRLGVSLLPALGKQHGPLADQLDRAVHSIPLNIAEGSGRQGKDRLFHLSVARGSAMECVAILDLGHITGAISDEDTRAGKALLDKIIRMLSGMTRGYRAKA